MTDYTELKRAAEASPGGPWVAENDSLYFKDDGYTRHLMDADAGHDVEDEAYYSALNFIAAANPAAVLALIAENEELRKDADRYRWLNTKSNTGPNICVSEWVGPHEYPLIGIELDVAVDTAMGKGEQS